MQYISNPGLKKRGAKKSLFILFVSFVCLFVCLLHCFFMFFWGGTLGSCIFYFVFCCFFSFWLQIYSI